MMPTLRCGGSGVCPSAPARTILTGMTTPSPGRPGIRISDADREQAAARLQQALAEGRISISELDERLAVVYAARYDADLLPPLADLPSTAPPVPQPDPRRSASAPMVPQVVLKSGMSEIKRRGAWRVPPRLRIQSVMGSVLLDFCEVEDLPAVIEIELDVKAGSVKLLVPDGATVDVDRVVATMGEIKCRLPAVSRPGAPHFVVHGRNAIGSVVIRHRHRFAGHRF
jgi:hypothetical protein